MILIKKYKNRRLYDIEKSLYITLEDLQRYIIEGKLFRVEEASSGKDITNTVLLQIIVEMEAGASQFLSTDLLRQIILFANHPLNKTIKPMMESMFASLNATYSSSGNNFEDFLKQWPNVFKG